MWIVSTCIILPQKTCSKYSQGYEVDLFCRPVWLTVQQVKGNYLIRKRWGWYVFLINSIGDMNSLKNRYLTAIFAFLHRISKQSVFDFPIPWFVRFDASDGLKILDVFLDCSDAYPQNHKQLCFCYARIVSDFRYDFASVGCHSRIAFIINFESWKHYSKRSNEKIPHLFNNFVENVRI